MKIKEAYEKGTNVGTMYKNRDFYNGDPMMTAAEVFNLLNTILWAAESVAVNQSGKGESLDNIKLKWGSLVRIMNLAHSTASDTMSRRWAIMKEAKALSSDLPLYDDESEDAKKLVKICNEYGKVDV